MMTQLVVDLADMLKMGGVPVELYCVFYAPRVLGTADTYGVEKR